MNTNIKQLLVILLIAGAGLSARAQNDSSSTGKKHCHMTWCSAASAGPAKGFRASMELAGIFGDAPNHVSERIFGHTFNSNMPWRTGLYVSLGYQFNPYFYLGGGMGDEYQLKAYDVFTDGSPSPASRTGHFWMIPTYLHAKAFLLNKRITPFMEMKAGAAPAMYFIDGKSAVKFSTYNGVALGVRLPDWGHMDANINVGYLFRWQPSTVSGVNEVGGSKQIVTNTSPLFENRLTLGMGITF